MKCPVDGATLLMTERSGVEIDYCPTCRGVWLDRGELDKIVAGVPGAEPAARAVTLPEPGAATGPSRVARGDDRQGYGDKIEEWRDRDEAGRDGVGGRRRRKGFLEDLFDF